MDIIERNGPKGGEYYDVELADGRLLTISRKPNDDRVWLGRPGEKGSYDGQPGGIGNVRPLLDDWLAGITDPGIAEQYWALRALDQAKRGA